MLKSLCVVTHYFKLEKKRRKENKNQRKKKKHVKHVVKSDELIHFCLMMSSVFVQISQVESVSAEETCLSHYLYK